MGEKERSGRRGSERRKHRDCGNGYSEDVVMLATSLAVQIARGKTECELETLINILDIMQDALIGVLAQRRICDRQRLEIIQSSGSDFII